jgi:hypothetical protein
MHATCQDAAELPLEEDSLPLTTFKGTRKVFIESVSPGTPTNVLLRTVGIEERYGHVMTISSSTSAVCIKARMKQTLSAGTLPRSPEMLGSPCLTLLRSAYHELFSPSAEMSVAPMDTTLAGIGTEKQFSGNEIDDPASGISLTPDQDTSQWTSFDPSSQGFAMDVDRSNATAHLQTSIKNMGNSGPTSQQRTNVSKPKSRQDSLNILADVASTQVSPDSSGSPSRPQFSSAPQTKAEQQRQALQKFSKAIVGEIQSASSADAVDLENVVLRVLYGVTSQNRQEAVNDNSSSSGQPERSAPDISMAMTKSEALKASQAISNLIKQSGSLPSASRPRRASNRDPSNKLKCDHCAALLSRSCDMKKHMKRHTKPYGCTYPKCHKRFGAKSDWKRHENSQHFQLESFRCCLPLPLPSSSQPHCTGFFQRPELFRSHLIKDHKLADSSIVDDTIKKRRIGKNGQVQFWCGFCGDAGEIVRLREKRNAAWDERFDHIDTHFSKEKKPIEEWFCVEAGKRKGDVMKDMDKTSFDEVGEDGMGETDGHSLASLGDDEPQTAAMPVPSSSTQPSRLDTKKRQLPVDDLDAAPVSKRRKRELNRYCVGLSLALHCTTS